MSGISFEADISVPSCCLEDENKMCAGFGAGERRVKNVMVGNVPLNPEKKYTLAGNDFILLDNGNGYTAFGGCAVLQDRVMLDCQLLADFISDVLGGMITDGYAVASGQGRIKISG